MDQLKPGDKLPSERDMAEDLQLSRSTIREGLRAIELIGLIETRRGEGTFLKSYQSYQTLSLLSTFIFQDPSSQKDVELTLNLVEQLIIQEGKENNLSLIINKWLGHDYNYWIACGYKQSFQVILASLGNELLSKIWYLLYAFRESLSENQASIKKFNKQKINVLFKQFDVFSDEIEGNESCGF